MFSFHSYLDIGETKKKPAEVNNEVGYLKYLRSKTAVNVSDMLAFMPVFLYIFIMFNNNTIVYHSEHIISVIITLITLSMLSEVTVFCSAF